MLTIKAIRAFEDNYIWLISDPTHHYTAVVDPGDATPVLHELRTKQQHLCAIFITHHHRDHIGGVATLVQHYGCPVYGPDTIVHVTHPVTEGAHIHQADLNLTLQVMAIPAHTTDHIGYYNDRWLFPGDTLFAAGCGRLFEGTASQLFSALDKIKQLPDQTEIYCAHEYTEKNLKFAHSLEPNNSRVSDRLANVQALRASEQITLPTTLLAEKATNPFLRITEPSLIACALQFDKTTDPNDPISVLTSLRRMRDVF